MDYEIEIADSQRQRNVTIKYSGRYRWLKSILLVLTWISFGLNFELIGITLEDLKIYLSVNYTQISAGPVLRNIGYCSLTILLGAFLDGIKKYSDLLMVLASILIAITNFLMPITPNYQVSMSYFFLQGLAQSIYDLTGISIIINLWKDTKSSPINALQGGYGIGACAATILAKPFIKFDADELRNTSDSTNNGSTRALFISKDEINVTFPYWMGSLFATTLTLMFLAAQLYENKLHSEKETNRRNYMLLMEDSDLEAEMKIEPHEVMTIPKGSRINFFMQKLLFGSRCHGGAELCYMLAQITLFLLLFVFTQGAFTIHTRFMLTYLSKGIPCQLDTKTNVILETAFWVSIIVSRFLAAFVTSQMKAMHFFLALLFFNTAFCGLFLLTGLTKYELFFWVCIPLVGFFTGPLIPCGLMIAKKVLEFNSFLLSVFIVGLAVGGIVFQELTGTLLDQKWPGLSSPAYTIPYLVFFCNLLSLLVFLLIFFLYHSFKKSIQLS